MWKRDFEKSSEAVLIYRISRLLVKSSNLWIASLEWINQWTPSCQYLPSVHRGYLVPRKGSPCTGNISWYQGACTRTIKKADFNRDGLECLLPFRSSGGKVSSLSNYCSNNCFPVISEPRDPPRVSNRVWVAVEDSRGFIWEKDQEEYQDKGLCQRSFKVSGKREEWCSFPPFTPTPFPAPAPPALCGIPPQPVTPNPSSTDTAAPAHHTEEEKLTVPRCLWKQPSPPIIHQKSLLPPAGSLGLLYDSSSQSVSGTLGGPWDPYFYNNPMYVICLFYSYSLMSIQWSFQRFNDIDVTTDWMQTNARLRIQQSSIESVTKKICKHPKECHSSHYIFCLRKYSCIS